MRMVPAVVAGLVLVALAGLALAVPFAATTTVDDNTAVPAGAPVTVRAHIDVNAHGDVDGPVAVRAREKIAHIPMAEVEHGRGAAVAAAHGRSPVDQRAREIFEKPMRARGVPPEEIQKRMDRYMRMGRDAMERAKEMVMRSAEIRKHYERMAQAYMRINDVIAQTARQFRLAEERWMRVRQMYLRGEVNESIYLEATKQFLITAIQATADRVKAFEQVSTDLNLNATVSADLNKLLQLEQEVNAATSIEEIRAIYPEIRELIQKINRETVLRDYAQLTVMYGESITMQLQVAAARLIAISTELNAEGKLDENTQAQISAIFAQIAQVRDEFNTLRMQLREGNIDTETFLRSVAELRAQIREIYREIVDLYRQMLRYRVEVRANVHAAAPQRVPAHRGPVGPRAPEMNAEMNELNAGTAATVGTESETNTTATATVSEVNEANTIAAATSAEEVNA